MKKTCLFTALVTFPSELAMGGSARGFLRPEPALGVSRRDIYIYIYIYIYIKRFNRRLTNQQWASWRGLGGTQRQARELISGPGRDAKAKLMSFNRT